MSINELWHKLPERLQAFVEIVAGAAILIVGVSSFINQVPHSKTTPTPPVKQPTASVVDPAAKCSLEERTFIDQLNSLRVSLGLGAVQEYLGMDQAAEARVNDMLLRKYYGHTNPINKTSAKEYVKAYAGLNNYGEILDGPFSATQAFNNFKNSPDHYQVMVNPNIKYIGLYSAYEPDKVQAYDINGNPLASPPTSQYCIVLVEVGF